MLPRKHSVQHVIGAGGASWRRSGSVRLQLSVQVGRSMGACCVQPAGLSAHGVPHSVLSSGSVVLKAVHAVAGVHAVVAVCSILLGHSVVGVRFAALHSMPSMRSVRLWVLRIVGCIVAGCSCVRVLGIVGGGCCVVVAVVLQSRRGGAGGML